MNENERQARMEEFMAALNDGREPSINDFCQGDEELRKSLRGVLTIFLAKTEQPFLSSSSSDPVRLDHYEVLKKIGKGGMGVVFKAQDLTLGRNVALKVISPELLQKTSSKENVVDRFFEEARIAGSLAHSSIVPVHGFGFDEKIDSHYIVMQLIDGFSLADLWNRLRFRNFIERREPHAEPASHVETVDFTPASGTSAEELTNAILDGNLFEFYSPSYQPSVDCEEHAGIVRHFADKKDFQFTRQYVHSVVMMVRKTADAIAHAHEQGISHRDIKPGNLLLDVKLNLWVADFGLAYYTSSTNLAPGGSARFMAPEQLGNQSDYDPKLADIYSLGITLYEMLTLDVGFECDDQSQLHVAIRNQALKVPLEQSQLPLDLQAVIGKSIAPKPEDRYETAGALSDDLMRFLDGDTVSARKPGIVENVVRKSRRHPAKAFASLLMAVVLCLIVGIAVFSRIAATNANRLRYAAEDARYMSEIRASYLQYDWLIDQQMIGPLNKFNPTTLGGNANVRKLPESVQSWESTWLSHLPSEIPDLVGRLSESETRVLDVELNFDKTLAVSIDASNLMVLWNLQSGQVTKRFAHGRTRVSPQNWIHHFEDRTDEMSMKDWGRCYVDVHWLDEYRFVGASLDGTVTIFDVRDNAPVDVVESDRRLTRIAFQNETLLIGDMSGLATLHSIDGKQVASFQAPSIEGPSVEGRSVEGTGIEANGIEITALKCLPNNRGWVMGFDDGRVVHLEIDTLTLLNEVQVTGPVWDVDAIETDSELIVAVGAEHANPQLVHWNAKGGYIERLRTVDELLTDEIHCVRFSADQESLYASNQAGLLKSWYLPSKSPSWSLPVAQEDRRNRDIADQTSEKIPRVFSRRIASIHEPEPGHSLLTAGEDLVMKVWEMDGSVAKLAHSVSPRLGEDPKIAFDANKGDWLWGIGNDGVLHLLDVDQDVTVATVDAHPGGDARLAISASTGIVATVCEESLLRIWECKEETIVPCCAELIRHTSPLTSVAISNDGVWVASVDVGGFLNVWEVETGEAVFQQDLSTEVKDPDQAIEAGTAVSPRTGKVAFNSDGSLLAAFGIGQVGAVFTTDGFRRLPQQIVANGNGGTAMAWNPRYRGVLLSADDYPFYETTVLDEELARLNVRSISTTATCVRMIATPDKRRMVCLEQEGRIVFVDAREHLPLLAIYHPKKFDSDLAIDRDGRRIAVASRLGEVETLDAFSDTTKKMDRVPSLDQTASWAHTMMVPKTDVRIHLRHKAVAFDQQGGVHFLIVTNRPVDQNSEGLLQYVCIDGQSIEREDIEIDDELTACFDYRSCYLALGVEDQPHMVVRKRNGTNWNGAYLYGKREDDWKFEVIHSSGNDGFYPFLSLNEAGEVDEVRHFSFDGFQALRSFPGNGGEEWNRECLGRKGDGFGGHYVKLNNGAIHSLSRWGPANSCRAAELYIEDGPDGLRRSFPFPYQTVAGLACANDRVFVLVRGKSGEFVMRRSERGWEKHLEVPAETTGSLQICSDGSVYIGPHWQESSSEVGLWKYDAKTESWAYLIIAKGPFPSALNVQFLSLDQQENPRIVLGDHAADCSWYTLLSPKDSR